MLTSQQIAALVSQNNQMFMGAAQYAQTISAQMPSPYVSGSIGAFGMGGMGGMGGGRPMSYGSSPFYGYGPGNAAAAMGMSAIGGGASMGAGLMADAGMWGMGSRAFSMARGAGAGIMGAGAAGMMAAAPMFAAGQVAQYGIGQMVAGAQEQQGIGSALGQFGFINPAARGGRGFSRADSQAVGDMVRQLSALPEMLASTQELTRIMDKMGQMGLMQGVRNVQEFFSTFRNSLSAVKDIAKIMGTSLEEALPIFQQGRAMGFYRNTDIVRNAVNQQITSGLTGMNQSQVAQLQMSGSQMAFQLGGSRAGGADLFRNQANQIGQAMQMGILSPDKVQEITGLSGAEGVQALAQQLGGAAYKMSRSSLGRAMGLALGRKEGGRYVGGVDQDMLAKFESGEIETKEDLLGAARGRLGPGRAGRLSFKAHEGRILTDTASAVGVQGYARELQSIAKRRGIGDEDAMSLLLQRYHLDEREADAVLQMSKSMPDIVREMGIKAQTEGQRIAQQTAQASQMSPDAIKRKIQTKIDNLLFKPELKKLGADISYAIAQTTDRFLDSFIDEKAANIDQGTRGLAVGALSGNKAAAAKLAGFARGTGGLARGGDMSGPEGLLDRTMAMGLTGAMFGPGTRGTEYADMLSQLGASSLLSVGKSRAEIMSGGGAHLSTRTMRGENMNLGISGDAAKQINNVASQFREKGRTGLDRAQQMMKFGGGKPMEYIVNDLGKLFSIPEFRLEMLDAAQSGDEMKKQRVLEKWMDSASLSLMDQMSKEMGGGLAKQEILARAQYMAGVSTAPEALNFKEIGNKLGLNVNSLSSVQKNKAEALSQLQKATDRYGAAILGSDSADRELLLNAVSGDRGAIEKITSRGGDLYKSYLQLEKSRVGGADVAGMVKSFRSLAGAESAFGLARSLKAQGTEMEARLGDIAGVGGQGAAGARAAISKFVKSLSGIDAESGAGVEAAMGRISSGELGIGEVLEGLHGIKDRKLRRKLASPFHALRAALQAEEGVLGSKAKTLEGLGITKDSAGAENWEAITKILGEGKEITSDTQRAQLAREFGRDIGGRALGGDVNQAARQRAQEASEKEAADSLKKMSENAQTTAQLLRDLGTANGWKPPQKAEGAAQ